MSTSKTTLATLTTLLLVAFVAPTARADEMSDLKARFQSRDAQIAALKKQGAIGETHLGYLESPTGSPAGDAAKLMAAENADRKRLYALIAEQQKSTPDLVANWNAKRNFDRAASGEYLKYPDGWHKK